jgi:hypothetical protein
MNNDSAASRQFTLTANSTNFAQNRDLWRDTCRADPDLTHADKNFIAQIHGDFNRKHHNTTGELKAYKRWETITSESGLSKATIHRAIQKIEGKGYLEVEHGRYNRKKGKRDRNRYWAKMPVQGLNLRRSKVSNWDVARSQDETRLSDKNDSLNKNDSMNLLSKKESRCFSESQSEESKGQARTAPSVPKEAKPAEDSKAARTPSRPSASSAATPSPSTSPSTPNPPVPRAAALDEGVPAAAVEDVIKAALAGHGIRPAYQGTGKIVRGVPPANTRRRGALAEDYEAWIAADGRTPRPREPDGSILVPDNEWLEVRKWVAAGRPQLYEPLEMAPALGHPGDSLADFVP